MTTVQVCCWGKKSGRLTFQDVPADRIKATGSQWLCYLAEQLAQERYGVRIHPVHAEVVK